MQQSMMMNKPFVPTPNFNGGDRFFPLFFPFLTGAVIGGAAVGLSRPRYYPYPVPYGYGYRPYF